MTRYFFHIRDGDRLERDRDGTDSSTIEAVGTGAVRQQPCFRSWMAAGI